MSVLFADLQGFTAFSERSSPAEVVAMLNAYWAEVVPVVAAEDGMIERFAGDAIMVVFNAAARPARPSRCAPPARRSASRRPPRRSPPGGPTGRASASASTPARR